MPVISDVTVIKIISKVFIDIMIVSFQLITFTILLCCHAAL
jgi:hypothetical protein